MTKLTAHNICSSVRCVLYAIQQYADARPNSVFRSSLVLGRTSATLVDRETTISFTLLLFTFWARCCCCVILSRTVKCPDDCVNIKQKQNDKNPTRDEVATRNKHNKIKEKANAKPVEKKNNIKTKNRSFDIDQKGEK